MTDIAEPTEADLQALRNGRAAADALATVGPHFQALKDAALKRWAESTSGQTDLREKLWITINTITCVERALQNSVQAAQFAADFNAAVAARDALAGEGLTRP